MANQIYDEVQLLWVCAYAGFILGISYDVIRIGRRVKNASVLRSILEDVLFWSVASIYLFQIFLKYNYGRPRYFGIGMAALSMILFEWILGRRIVPWSSKKIRRILRIAGKPLKKIKNTFTLLGRKFRKNCANEEG